MIFFALLAGCATTRDTAPRTDTGTVVVLVPATFDCGVLATFALVEVDTGQPARLRLALPCATEPSQLPAVGQRCRLRHVPLHDEAAPADRRLLDFDCDD